MDESPRTPRRHETPRTAGPAGPPLAAQTDEQRIHALIAELNALVPRVENQVRVLRHGDEPLDLMATRAGALRLGVAILRAAIEEHDPHTRRTNAEAELHALVDADGDTWIESVFIERELPARRPAEDERDDAGSGRRSGPLAFYGALLLVVGVVIVFSIGIWTAIGWL
jgi:hypothetical protein